jgi:uncharacterized membrane protein required for colicin V production
MMISIGTARGTFMIMDILVGLILVGAMVHGLRKGFIHTFIHTIGWVLALVLAYIATPFVKRILMGETTLYDTMRADFAQRFSESLPTTQSSFESLPANIGDAIGDKVTQLTDSIVQQTATAFAGLAFTIMVFVGLVVVIKVILWLVLRLLSKDYNDGFMNFFDGLFGLIFGLFKGLLMAFIFLAVLLPVLNTISPDYTMFVIGSLDNSLFAKDLYDNNFIVLLLQSFFK